jgi:virginiamycin B lyase
LTKHRYPAKRRSDSPPFVAAILLCCTFGARATDSYNGVNLTMPTMTVGNAVYSDVVVAVGQILSGPTAGPANGTADSYNSFTRQLTVPAVVYGGKTYYNVVVTVKALVSVGSVSGADSYASSRLTISEIQTGCAVYSDVVLAVTPGDIASVAWGMPLAALDQYTASAGEVLIPAVQVGSNVYMNVTINAGPQNIVSVGGSAESGTSSASSLRSGSAGSSTSGAGPGSSTPFLCQITTRGQISGLTLSPTGVPYFLDQTNSAVGYINAQGEPVEYGNLGPTPAPIEGVFNYETGFAGPAFGPDGNIYFPYFNANTLGTVTDAIGQINPATGVFTQFPIPTTNAGPFSIVLGPDDALWFTEFSAGQIGRLTTAGAFTEFALPSGTSALPTQIVVGPDGALWFPESGSGKIGRIPTTATPANPQVTEYPMSYPGCISNGIASGPLNSLWYVGCLGSVSNFTIDQVSLAGVQTIYDAPSGFAFADPRFLTVGADGALWISDQNANYIDRLVPIGGGLGAWSQYAYPLVHMGCCGNASANWIVSAPDGSLWWTEFNTGNVGHLIP